MATPSIFSTFSSLSPPKLLNFHFLSLNLQVQYFHLHHHHYLHSHRLLLPPICASTRKPSSRNVRSNADLCNDLREFMYVVGLPDDHVPTLKELSQHGRPDLANIVRRRGYKLISELLATSIKTETNVFDDEVWTEVQDKASATEEKSTESQNEKVNGLGEDVTSSSEALVVEEKQSSVHIESHSKSSFEESIIKKDSTELLLEKAAKFIQDGQLEIFEDIRFNISNENAAEVDEEISESPILAEPLYLASNGEIDQLLYKTDTDEESIEISLSSHSDAPSTLNNSHLRKDNSSKNRLVSVNRDKELDVEAGTTENHIEVDRLKSMLHQKELELSHLKQQIEKEKQVLSNLQNKVETEISKAQKLILDKDAELQAAEDTLSGLHEVLIEYSGFAQTVEVAGSFNGWHQPVKLDLQPSSSITDPTGLRNMKHWRSILWLYPGVYQIKFIVDGQWTIDPERESISLGGIQNNILRVGR